MDVDTTTQETQLATPVVSDDAWQEASDEDLVAAAKEAGGAASVDVAAEAAAAGKPPPEKVTPTAEEPAVDPNEPKIAAVIRAREKAFAERQGADDYAAKRRAQAEQEAADVLAKARERAAADYEAELTARRAKFREAPGAALRELGFSPDELVDGVTREGTAEWKAMRALQQELAATKERAGTAEKVAADFEAFKREMAQQKEQARTASIREAYLTQYASPEKTPYLHRRYDQDEIFDKSNALAIKWQQAGIPFAHSDVAEYLEAESRKRLSGVTAMSPPQQVSGAQGNAPKVKANGSRTLSAANGSERRASPKPIEEMSPEEERAALIEAAAEARRTGGD